ncbi:hypothetical protein BS614_10175 [Paenibacillus xylanexedens]|uniref:hypothetical protein n=1 Tax=Paenibacillus xylanexedens TaxID=528191 RepID=UPI000938122B|nr:hypothetical protein [Paenibacillus xylanexedens]APO44335.1 hypothetical protein BS614_10175 [Paenibacillus xylanexedens]
MPLIDNYLLDNYLIDGPIGIKIDQGDIPEADVSMFTNVIQPGGGTTSTYLAVVNKSFGFVPKVIVVYFTPDSSYPPNQCAYFEMLPMMSGYPTAQYQSGTARIDGTVCYVRSTGFRLPVYQKSYPTRAYSYVAIGW